MFIKRNRCSFVYLFLYVAVSCFFYIPAKAQSISLKNGVVNVSPVVPSPMHETVFKVLSEEIAKRTGIVLKTGNGGVNGSIIITLSSDPEYSKLNIPFKSRMISPEFKKEGFRVFSIEGKKIWIVGADSRGVLFGAGWLLRHLQMGKNMVQLDAPVDVASSPAYPIRGHQLGYRTTANSYDAWSVAQFEQYYRDLAIFGTNAIEGIPFQEGEAPSPHFKISSAEMRIKMSELCQQYDMDYWVWTPATFDLKDTEKRKAELDMHEAFYKACPRLDHIFFPGGDPGENHPSDVMPFLKDIHDRLVKYHPNAKVWISLQGFNEEQVDYFYRYLREQKPDWLEGVVSGPGSPPMAETRFRLPAQYKHREYPDITHAVRCEFPVEKWDQAYALTLGRESVNPRPFNFSNIQHTYAPFTDGFVSYSDGCHDDINKIIWSMGAWDPNKDVNETLEEYARFFFGENTEKPVAAGIAALEQNWRGPLAQNGGVETTFSFWKNLEATHPSLKNNWRWQMLLLRAYYDTYTRRRLIYEQELEKNANEILSGADTTNITQVMKTALGKVNEADNMPISTDLRKRIEDLCADLYTSIGLQTSVPKYKARGYERGAVLDFVDYPLNNRWWLADEFAKIDSLTDKKIQWQQLQQISHWENPGAGNYYDDISSITKGPRVKTISDDATDIAWWDNGKSRKRLSFQTFQRCPVIEYTNLDPNTRYIIRVCGYGDALIRADGQRLSPTMYNKEADTFKEWVVPLNANADGKMTITFDEPEESQLNWRKNSKVYDIWLLKQQ
ncbi:MAG: hypothetical protein QM802_18880 [Agriterribacter sp.]